MKRIQFVVALAVVCTTNSFAHAQSRTQNGATAGGVAGAIIGGIIGHQNDETPEGALIGGAVGAIAGGMLGRSQDNALQRQQYEQQQVYYRQQQQIYAQQQAIAAQGISTADIVNMSRSGLSESLIISQLHTKGVQRRLEVSEIIALHQQGLSDTLIGAMQSVPLASQLNANAGFQQAGVQQFAATPVIQQTIVRQPIVQQSRVIVQEPLYYRGPVVYEQVYRGYPVHHQYAPRRSSNSLRIGF